MTTAAQHYTGKAGVDYFHGRFGEISEFGRKFQSLYFLPYCDTEKRILDFGCGDGTILRELPAKSRIGVELNPVCQEYIRKKNSTTSPIIQLFDNLSFIPDSSVDIAISNHSLEHILEPYQILVELKRVLAPGGRLVLVIPFDDWRSKSHARYSYSDKDHHLYTWSPLNIANLTSEAGFEVLESYANTQAWSPKLFWVGRVFGLGLFRQACKYLAILKNRREVVCVARKPLVI